ncbi:sporulation inhibitor of replication protein SirA [Bacillus sp. FJAT-29790]|uniref:sporulation inhibitor of replication protein SirA n=1 Tax=Bacillus sp. FJAT-29790 TaxID=1895002 RepID=UPI001C245F3D|nr:sporulation inhibitor of replication protein SirA [Bacillus sp. FJAT-29790]MBU8877934.1 sporulation inhibitor of replication protein SirA [Bacillus sp. FJAT-29790]
MRAYRLYLIEEEFASHYFGRERMFFQLFQEYENSSGTLKSIIAKQIQFITKPIPGLKLHQYINQQLFRKKDFLTKKGAYYIEMGKRSHAKLEVYDQCLVLKANGNYDAETVFFEVLRKSESSFLAIDIQHHRYGWLKPIKERKFV